MWSLQSPGKQCVLSACRGLLLAEAQPLLHPSSCASLGQTHVKAILKHTQQLCVNNPRSVGRPTPPSPLCLWRTEGREHVEPTGRAAALPSSAPLRPPLLLTLCCGLALDYMDAHHLPRPAAAGHAGKKEGGFVGGHTGSPPPAGLGRPAPQTRSSSAFATCTCESRGRRERAGRISTKT